MSGETCPTAKLEKLLLATDASEYSEGAVREALRLAKQCSSRLIAMSVVITNLELEETMPKIIESEEKKAYEHLEAIKERASKEGIDCSIAMSHGDEPYQDIVRRASESRVDMIVMGKHGRTGLLRLMMGSVAAKVIGYAPCNVLVVSPTATIDFKNVLIATDGSLYSEAAAHEAIGISKRYNSHLIALSVASSEVEVAAADYNVRKTGELAAKDGIKVDGLTVFGKPYEAITEAAKQKGADLIVVGSHGRKGLERLLMGSVTERLIGHTEKAVLVVKKQRTLTA
jgi:nucleotide-binding universal stress UspA family protein